MDCRTCQPTLIDLLYGELATDAAEAARAHLRECASCRSAYDKLAVGLRVARTLEVMEPPAQIEHKLLELAQARALVIAEQRAAAAPPVLSPWRVAIDFVRRFAMASQVKMVAASALVVTVVLLALPRLWRESQMVPMSPVAVTVSPAQQVAEEAAPSDGVQPAEPLGLKMDSSGRIRSTEDEAAAEASARPAPAAEPASSADLDQRDEKKSVMPRAQSTAHRAYRARDDLEYDKSESLAKGKQRAADADELMLNGYRKDAPPRPAAASPAPSPFPSNEGELARESAPRKVKISGKSSAATDPGLSGASSSFGQASGAGVGSASQGRAAPMPAAKPTRTVDELAVRQPTVNLAEAAPSPPQGKESRPSRLQTARAIAQRDGCAAALSSYEQAVAAGSTTLEAGEALLDMAHCRISLGQPAIARALLERASRIPAVAPRARAMLESSAAASAPAGPAAEPPK